MMFKTSDAKGYSVLATDGSIGTVADLLFDDRSWKVRWLVVDTGTFMPGRKVLIHPEAVAQAVHDQEELLLTLTKAQVEASPDVDKDLPVSRQMESHLNDYYGWDPYWGSTFFGTGAIASPVSPPPLFGADLPEEADIAGSPRNEGDPHLRSIEAVTSYRLQASDGEIGHIEDFLADDKGWELRYLVVDTRVWWSGNRVLVSPYAVRGIDWDDREVRVDLTREQIQKSPAWDSTNSLDPAYEEQLHEHYGWDGYGWNRDAQSAEPRPDDAG